jgi:hypothetical protein
MSMKNYKDTIGNGTRELSACRAVGQLRHRIKRDEIQNVQTVQTLSWKNFNAQDVWYVYKRVKLR